MRFTWDDAKAAANLRKHGIAFEVAAKAWDDPAHLLLFDRIENGEERWHLIGLVYGIVVVTVVHAYPDPADDQSIRIIGARKATAAERRRYEANDV